MARLARRVRLPRVFACGARCFCRSRHLPLVACVAVLVACLVTPGGAADDPELPHLRAADGQILQHLREGCRRSATFKRLVEEVEHSDLIVYFEATRQVPRAMRAYLQLAGAARTVRFLRIAVRIPASADILIAQIGHELQHATEVARATEVRDQAGMEALYRRIGDQTVAGWDTAEARRTGDVILAELRHDVRTQKADAPPAATVHPDTMQRPPK